ncbi:MAG: type I restriction endonuclease subunit R [Ruminococcaceae bacterium]|nr:type I restriction endonuclease subunit R [Oscillospiraceae bacterium]
MPHIDQIEKATQKRVIKFFVDKLHYTYLGDLHDSENSNIMQERLYSYLTGKGGYSGKVARRAIDELVRTSGNLQHGLYDANKEVYRLLKYGAKIVEEAGEAPKTVFFIDFSDASKNDFAIAEEVTVVGENVKRPDLVIYVNGIALAVIELKRSSTSVSEGIRQNLTNQKANFIEKFFSTMQFCMAGNDSEGLRYGTLRTPEKHLTLTISNIERDL